MLETVKTKCLSDCREVTGEFENDTFCVKIQVAIRVTLSRHSYALEPRALFKIFEPLFVLYNKLKYIYFGALCRVFS